MLLSQYFNAIGANVDFTPYEANAVVSLAPPENRFAADSNGVEYFALIELPADYTLELLVGTAYSTRELFVECLTGDLDLRQ